MTMIEIYNDLLFSIRQATFVPYFGPGNKEATTLEDAAGWCEGFFYGMSLHGDEWMNSESSEIASLTAPILYMANPREFGKELPKEKRKKFAERQKELIESIRYNIPPIYDFWNIGVKPEIKKDLLGLGVEAGSGQN
jgi:yecA family protein